MSGSVNFLSYADEMFRDGQGILANSARRVGFDSVVCASPRDWQGSDFAIRNRGTLEQKRGGGYWLWKPWLIRRELELLGQTDVLFYSDASVDGYYRFDKFPAELVALVQRSKQGFVIGPAIPQHGPLSRWVKRDALILLDTDRPEYLSRPLLQATWSLWRNTPESMRFLDLWLDACCDARVLTDMPNTQGEPNYPDFVDHRHDQSVLSLLAYREGVDVLDIADTGIFMAMALRPNARMTHRFLKAPRNVERLLSGQSATVAFLGEALKDRFKRLVSRGNPA